jgi:hypothetical protein
MLYLLENFAPIQISNTIAAHAIGHISKGEIASMEAAAMRLLG